MPSTKSNLLLPLLSPSVIASLGPMEAIDLPLRTMLEPSGKPIEFIYFLQTGMASVVADMSSGDPIELGMIGREGVTGLAVIAGGSQTPFDTFMQIEGSALRMPVEAMTAALASNPSLRAVLALYAHAFSIQLASTAAANGRTSMEGRLARWLLMVSDRVGRDFHITHEFLGVMLASPRPGVSLAMHKLSADGLIRSTRNGVGIVNRTELIARSGNAYGVAEREYKRLMVV
jgi:CRP-like cAMP-binding protein